MPLQATSGAASQDAFGGNGVAVVPAYIEEVFSTYLYTGTGAALTITNNIDLSTKGGLVWIKKRVGAASHALYDSGRGINKSLSSDLTAAQNTNIAGREVTAYNTTGFSLGTNQSLEVNDSGDTFASWTFRKQPKFFDVVTFTKSSSSQVISHNLNSTAGCIFIKRTDSTGGWLVAHRGYTGGITAGYTLLNATNAFTSSANAVTAADSTSFTLGSDVANGDFVAYLFAHDAGGFGLTGTDNVISCGGYTGNGSTSGPTVTLGYEPQWIIIKRTDSTGDWRMFNNMIGLALDGNTPYLKANTADATSSTGATAIALIGTGFQLTATGADYNASGGTYIYIAIRRGPMKVPTTGTSVFTPAIRTGDGATSVNVTNATFPVDLVIGRGRSTSAPTPIWIDRLRGATVELRSDNTDAEAASTIMSSLASQTGWIGSTGGSGSWNISAVNYIQWYMRRAPSFFDEVCYTGTGTAGQTFAHNLGVVPELMIVKQRNTARAWIAYSATLGNTKYLVLNSTAAEDTGTTTWNDTSPTSSVFSLGSSVALNQSGGTFVNYLFATCAGVSKVGSYTGTGTTQTINCGFTAGSRFVMIKRTDSTGDWYVWDSARGIVAGNDPYLLLNSTAAEVTNTDYVDTANSGFEISSTAPAAINANGGTFIFLAIA